MLLATPPGLRFGFTWELQIRVLRQTIAHLQRSLARLSKAALALLSRDPQLQRRLQLLDRPKGMTALAVLGELVMIGERSARELTKHAGLDEVEFTSGSSVQKKPHISHVGITSASFSSLLRCAAGCALP